MPNQPDLFSALEAARAVLDDKQERYQRALTLAAGLGMHSSRLLTTYINHCNEGAQAGEPKPVTSQEEFSYCVKTLICVSLWLILLEQEKKTPQALNDLITDAMNISDRLYDLPPAREVMRNYDVASGAQTVRESVSFNICLRLNLGGTAADALVQLAALLKQARPAREELVVACLTKSLTELDEMIRSA